MKAYGDLCCGGHWGGGCSLKAVNSAVNRASDNPRSTPRLLKEYKRHHKSNKASHVRSGCLQSILGTSGSDNCLSLFVWE